MNIKPCPKCGGKAYGVEFYDVCGPGHLTCDKCGYGIIENGLGDESLEVKEIKAINRWNTESAYEKLKNNPNLEDMFKEALEIIDGPYKSKRDKILQILSIRRKRNKYT